MGNAQEKFSDLVGEISSLPPKEGRIAAFQFVRDIPYGNIGSRDPYEVLSANMGTCSGKHALLKLIFQALGYDVQSWFALHDFSKFPIEPWPETLAEFRSQSLPDYHDFLKVNIDGKWITIDAIFDKALSKLGFAVQDWGGVSDMNLPIQAEKVFMAEGSMEDHKKRLISELPLEQQAQRKKFLEALTSWLNANRPL